MEDNKKKFVIYGEGHMANYIQLEETANAQREVIEGGNATEIG